MKEEGRWMVCLLTPVVISLVLLSAHFLRAGHIFPVVAALCLLPLLMVRRPWVARTVQVALLAGSLEWVRTLLQLSEERLQAGQPVLRLILILAIVAGVTLISALAFQTQTLKRTYRFKTKERVERQGGQPST